MKTKEKVLELLLNNSGEYISGQDIAERLFVTRASVWKAIKSLKEAGHKIDAVTNKGYRIRQNIDLIKEQFVVNELDSLGFGINVKVYDEVTSTNDEAIRLSRENEEDYLVIADCQSKGRGRRGREFFSPKGTGLYMSYAFSPDKDISEMENITALSALALAMAIDEVVFDGKKTAQIKWVNDIFIDGLKVAGILTEAYTSMEFPLDNRIVIGWGINVYMPLEGFPKEISKTAGYLVKGDNDDIYDIRSRLAVSTYKHLMKLLVRDSKELLELYKDRLFIIGSYLKINQFGKKYKYGYAHGINDKYHLIVEYDDGKTQELFSGEVSVVRY